MQLKIALLIFQHKTRFNGDNMYRLLTILLFGILFFTACSKETAFKGKFYYSSERISPGDEIVIHYNPDSTILSGSKEVKCIAYLFNKELINAVDVSLNFKKNILTGKLKTDEKTLGVLLKFKTDDLLDNNSKKGYIIYLSDKNGKQIPGSLAGYAAAINRWGAYYLDLDRDKEKALKLLNEEFQNNPDQKKNYYQPYFEVINAVKVEEGKKILSEELTIIEKRDDKTEDDYTILAKWYGQIGDTSKVEYYDKYIKEIYPQSEYLQEKQFIEYGEIKDVDKKIEYLEKFKKEFQNSDYIVFMNDQIVKAYRDQKDYKKALEFLRKNQNQMNTLRFYSVVDRLLEENADMNLALEIAKLGEERNRQEVKSPSEEKPEYLSESEWLQDREYNLGLTLFAKGEVLYRQEKKTDCIPIIEEAVKLTNNNEGEINELYSKVLVENGQYSKAINRIDEFIKLGYGTENMKEYLREAYLNEKGNTEGFDAYVSESESAASQRLSAKLKGRMISEPAPEFTLIDLDGKKISLKDLKGKTIIIDFWATWCGPCLASFPGMKKAVERYKDNPDVRFLFINTWEREGNIKQNAKDFITKNDYPFQVLLDEKNEVIEKYKVSGIPTKFIIDKDMNIKFMSVGYSGSEDQLVEELSVMISMIQ